MRKLHLLVSAAAVLTVSAAASSPVHAAPPAAAAKPEFGTWGFDTSGEDTAIKPGDDFFGYANGAAVKKMVIPADMTNYGNFIELAQLSEKREHQILDDESAHVKAHPVTATDKAGAYYKSFMDEKTVEKRGAAPLKAGLDQIRAIHNLHDFAVLQGNAQKSFQASLFGMSIQPDAKDPNQYSIQIEQAGLGLPDRDYYLQPQFAEKKTKYGAYVTKMLTLAGWPQPDAASAQILAFEQEIANQSWARDKRRDPNATYNPTTLDALQKAAPGFDWATYFKAADLGAPDHVVLSEKSAILQIADLTAKTPISTLQAWAAFHLISNAASYLSHDFDQASFEFNGHELTGQPQQKPRWKRAVHATDSGLGEAVGQEYVARYFPPDAKAQMEVLTTALRDAFKARLEKNDWMTAQTKARALEKLSSFDFQIGYPKKWRDYSTLVVKPDDLFGNVERSTAFEWAFWVGHLGQKVDRDQWDMFPQTVNAYNNPNFNEVVFPAAILQPPFFDPHADAAVNYGAIGGVIGHEMTHSFDDEGRKFDAQGRLNEWWTKADSDHFDERAKKYGAQFAAMQILPGAHINPALTMGENIADLGGLTLALDAYHASLHGQPAPVIDGTTGDQRVFLGWAQVWRAKVRDDAARQRLTIDPHSPPIARVDIPMRNIDFWYAAFGVKPGDKEYLAPQDRVKIW